MPYSSKAVANFFIEKGVEASSPVDAMKLQKLLYFAHGWHIATSGGPLLDEMVEAWRYGPVAPSIYHEFKSSGSSPIEMVAFEFGGDVPTVPEVSEKPTLELLEQVWGVYGGYSSLELSQMSHDKDGPWSETWENEAASGQIKHVDIPPERIKQYFKDLARRGRA